MKGSMMGRSLRLGAPREGICGRSQGEGAVLLDEVGTGVKRTRRGAVGYGLLGGGAIGI